jgi:hypothetical protein
MRTVIYALSAGLVLVLSAVPATGQEQERPSFSGTWQFDASKSELHSSKISSATWVIEEGDNSIHISQAENGKSKKTELQCTTDGKECKFPGDRRDSFWFNGPMLVDIETKNDRVIRYRMKISDDGKTLTVEVTAIVPQSDKIETLVFQK